MNGVFYDSVFYGILVMVYFYIVASTLFTIIKDKRDPVKTISWVVVILSLPVAGFILYIMIGQNFRKRKILTRKFHTTNSEHKKIVKSQLRELSHKNNIENIEIRRNRDLITLLLNNSRSPLTENNYVEILNNGDNTFDKIIYELQNAKRFIHIEYYILIDDMIGNIIADILIEKAESGVEVRLIYDDVGSWSLPKTYTKKLRDAGVKVAAFMPVTFPIFTSRLNNRNHRKIIIIDGDKGFTGGINIADKYIHGNDKVGSWRDTHLYLEGDANLSLHAVFATDWLFLTGEHLDYNKYFVIGKELLYGNAPIQIASSGPDSDWQTIMQVFFSAITRANEHIYISTPYFLPNNSILTALKVAAMSGKDVKIMIPANPDSKIVYWATCSYISELLKAKIKVYFYKAGFNHSKIIMIDSTFCSIGTANMDVRSFDANFEVTALLYSSLRTKELEKEFLKDLENCEEMTLSKWKSRKRKRSLLEGIARLFTPLL